MRALTLDEKISLKGILARYGVPPGALATLTTATALYYWHKISGKSIAQWYLRQHPSAPRRNQGVYVRSNRVSQVVYRRRAPVR
jgi:hypothetical protein